MLRTIVVTAVGTAVLAGTGVAALAASNSPGQPGSGSTSSSAPAQPGTAAAHKKHAKRALWEAAAKRAVQGDVVVKGKDGSFTTVEFARGTATLSPASTPTSVSVRTADGQTVTFTLNAATKYHVRADKKTTKGSVSSLHSGDSVVVVGKAPLGTGTVTATQVLDLGPAA